VARRKTVLTDWYSVSVDTLRGWGIFVFVVTAAVVGYFGFREWERHAIEREAVAVVDESRVLIQRLHSEPGLADFRSEYDSAWATLQQARAHLGRKDYPRALSTGRRARALVLSVLDALRHKGAAGEAQFVTAQGGVDFRRGENGRWEEARGRVVLRSGDYVKTSPNGSAEIMFVDGTLYTVRPNTLFLVTRTRNETGIASEQAIRMQYGWVDLSTAQNASRIATPSAEARVAEESEGSVAYDESTAQTRFAALRGRMEVISGDSTRRLSRLQQVVQDAGGKLSGPRGLPGRPQVVEPTDNLEINLDRTRELRFVWQPVAGAATYAFQVSRSRLFVDNIIDVAGRTTTRATLGVHGEGSFLWRVAAIGREGAQGPWSAPRRLRIASLRGAGSDGDRTPPALDLDDVKSYGAIFIFAGHTEPGSTVEVNGEAVAVAADGTFTKTIQLAAEGWSFVELKARDASGNETVRRKRVFVESL